MDRESWSTVNWEGWAGFFFMVTGASSGAISGQFLGDAAPLAHGDPLGCHQREPGRRGYQKWRRGVQKQTKRVARAEGADVTLRLLGEPPEPAFIKLLVTNLQPAFFSPSTRRPRTAIAVFRVFVPCELV